MFTPRLLPLLLLPLLSLTIKGQDAPPVMPDHPAYLDPAKPLESRVDDLMSYMTQDEKIQLLRAVPPALWSGPGIARLHMPRIATVDAGQGVNGGDNNNRGPATLFTSGVLLASTWDTDLARQVGQGIGIETINKGGGGQVLLGPGINIHRSPLGGRNGEYFSEDPYLASRMAVNYIEGLQSTGVAACVKHFACNNEEGDRGDVSVLVDERALREIYLYSFEAAVREAHSWSIMASYNKIRGDYLTSNHYLLTDILRKDWGFDGCVLSDWGAVHAPTALAAGTDLDMGSVSDDGMHPDGIKNSLKNGTAKQEDVDRAVRNILRLAFRIGLFDAGKARDASLVNSAEHDAISQRAGEEGIVLLKNENKILPLDPGTIHSIALIGAGIKNMQLGAEGSPHVTPGHSTQPYDGIAQKLGAGVTIHYAEAKATVADIPVECLTLPDDHTQHGFRAEYFGNPDLKGTPVVVQTEPKIDYDWSGRGPVAGIGANNFSVRWTGEITAPATGTFTFSCAADDGCRVYVDGKLIVDHWMPSIAMQLFGVIDLEKGKTYPIKVEYFQYAGQASASLKWIPPGLQSFQEAADAAKVSDVAIVCVNTRDHEQEGTDRETMHLPAGQDELIKTVLAANPRTIVVLNNGTPIDMSAWLDQTPALIEAWFPGQEGGRALASILFGDVNPSGKLPDTFGVHREDYPDYGNFPGTNRVVHYAEGIYVGYRSFDKKNITPAYPFGFGLSYTTFSYANLKLSSAKLSSTGSVSATVDITNTGNRTGDEVVELYVHDPHPTLDKAVRELKGFARVSLKPGETKPAAIVLKPRDLAYCDVPNKQWKANAGDYEIQVGASSRDIRQKITMHLQDDFTESIPQMLNPAGP